MIIDVNISKIIKKKKLKNQKKKLKKYIKKSN